MCKHLVSSSLVRIHPVTLIWGWKWKFTWGTEHAEIFPSIQNPVRLCKSHCTPAPRPHLSGHLGRDLESQASRRWTVPPPLISLIEYNPLARHNSRIYQMSTRYGIKEIHISVLNTISWQIVTWFSLLKKKKICFEKSPLKKKILLYFLEEKIQSSHTSNKWQRQFLII